MALAEEQFLQFWHGQRPHALADNLLGAVCYGVDASDPDALASVPMKVLPAGGLEHTAWESAESCTGGEYQGCQYRFNQHLLFGAITLAEGDFTASVTTSTLQQASQVAYERLFAVMGVTGFPHLVRCWNYLPRINVEGEGLERYRQFNIGRQDAFIAAQRSYLDDSPAACALGTAEGGLVLYFLASHAKPVPVENPRQVSAYRYPERYGPRSPTFSRASLLPLPGGEALFISGTASILGCDSCHPGDVIAQTEETLRNIEAVIEQANRLSAVGGYASQALELKVFLRDPADYSLVESVIQRHFGVAACAMYLQADICRTELLVEIEAVGFRWSH